ncbi:MAG: ribosome recycling factor, partial [Thermoanaerobaculia bacterium]
MIEDIKKEIQKRMEGAINHFQEELKALRTGRATPAILESVKVPYYGTPTPVNQVANIMVPDPTLLIVQPWDPSLLLEIEKAIRKADLGLNPINDGKTLKIPIPPLTEERRRELSKKAKEMSEAAKNAIRNIRRDGNEQVKKAEKDKKISEDERDK